MLWCRDGPCFYLCWHATSTAQKHKLGPLESVTFLMELAHLSHIITSHYCCYHCCNLVYRTAGYMDVSMQLLKNP